MTGFVYIWFDRKRKMYYIGSHKGKPIDKYICSSTRMKHAYIKRSDDFKRRIIYTGLNFREIEQLYLNKIQTEELGTKYYNLKQWAAGGNGGANKGTIRSEEYCRNMSAIKMGSPGPIISPEGIERIRHSKLGKPRDPNTRAKIAATQLGKKRKPYGKRTPIISCEHCKFDFHRPKKESRFCSNRCSQLGSPRKTKYGG